MILQAGQILKQNKKGRSRFQAGLALSVRSSCSVPSCSHSPPPSARTDGSANSLQTETQRTFPLFVLQTDSSATAFQTFLCRGSWGTARTDTGKCPESFVEGVRNLTRSCLTFLGCFLGTHQARGQKGWRDSRHSLPCYPLQARNSCPTVLNPAPNFYDNTPGAGFAMST